MVAGENHGKANPAARFRTSIRYGSARRIPNGKAPDAAYFGRIRHSGPPGDGRIRPESVSRVSRLGIRRVSEAVRLEDAGRVDVCPPHVPVDRLQRPAAHGLDPGLSQTGPSTIPAPTGTSRRRSAGSRASRRGPSNSRSTSTTATTCTTGRFSTASRSDTGT